MSETLRWPRRVLSGAANVFAAGAISVASATAFGIVSARQFGIRYETWPLLPSGHQPLRILHLSDMHLVANDRRKIEFVRSLAALQPDLVVNTGDNPGGLDAVDDVIEALEPLLDIPGVFVAGSNDYYGPRSANPLRYLWAPTTLDKSTKHLKAIDARYMFSKITASGQWHHVGNRSLVLPVRDNVTFNFAGTHDAHMHADTWPGFAVDADATGQSAAQLKIAVTHAPYRRVLDAAVVDGADIVFAGHTHGGQIALPAYGSIVANCDVPTGLASGLFPWRAGGQQSVVNITAGIGASPTVPLRTFCPPEAVVLDIVAAELQASTS